MKITNLSALSIIITFTLILNLSSCVTEENVTETNVADSLKISTYLIANEYDGNGYWEYDAKDMQDFGRWICDDGTVIENAADVFVHEELELNCPRTMARIGYGNVNLNIHIDSEDVINVSVNIIGNNDIVLSYSPSSPDKVLIKDWCVSNDITTVGAFTVNVFPIGKIIPADTRNGKLCESVTLSEREYYIDIETFTLDGRPRVTAQLKLTAIEDLHLPEINMIGSIYSQSDNLTRFLEIELVKYSYSDTALHDEFEKYDHLYN